MKKFMLYVLIPCVMLALVSYFYYSYTAVMDGSTETNLNYILNHINGQGQLVDYQNNINCKGIEDIRLYVKDGTYVIKYGKIELKWKSEKDLLKQDNLEKLARCGITIYRDSNTNELRFFYGKTELERWVS